jgi:hypothetical protein
MQKACPAHRWPKKPGMLNLQDRTILGIIPNSKNQKVIKQLEFQSSKKMERLSYETFYLGKLAQKEAVAVRIITIVSLVYLPCSVVSVSWPAILWKPTINQGQSIFSTDIVKFQTGTIGVYKTSFSWLALQRWIEVTFPLTFVTLTLGFFGYQFEKWRQNEDIKQERDELMSLETHETLGTIWIWPISSIGVLRMKRPKRWCTVQNKS